MNTGITNNLPATAARDSWEVEYVLTKGDYLVLGRYSLRSAIKAGRQTTSLSVRFLQGLWSALYSFSLSMVTLAFIMGTIVLVTVYLGAVLVWLLFGCVSILLIGFWYRQHKSRSSAVTGLVDLCYQLGVYRAEARYRVLFTANGIVERMTYQKSDEGIELLEQKESRASWDAVAEIISTQLRILFDLRDKGCLIVPPTAFSDEDEKKRFLMAIQRWRKQPRVAMKPDQSPAIEGIRTALDKTRPTNR